MSILQYQALPRTLSSSSCKRDQPQVCEPRPSEGKKNPSLYVIYEVQLITALSGMCGLMYGECWSSEVERTLFPVGDVIIVGSDELLHVVNSYATGVLIL
jgi:hypothetical protein